MARPTRIELARRRLRLARYSIAAVTITAFAAFGLAVRDAHPATHTTTTSNAAANTTLSSQSSVGGSAVITPAPQAVAPTIQSSGS